MNNTKIMFFGTTDFSRRILEELIDANYQVVAVVSQPDRPVGRKHQIMSTPVHETCIANHIPCLQPEKISLIVDDIASYQPDLIITCAYGQFISSAILAIPSLGCLNIHPSLLPKYRGGAPIQHAVMNGDRETGVSIQQMVKKMDAGDVYASERIAIGEDETFAQLNQRLVELSVKLLKEMLPKYIAGQLVPVQQDESKIVLALNITPEEEQVSFAKETVDQIYNHIRGLIDWPIAYGTVEGKRMKFYKVGKENKTINEQPGTILGFHEHSMEIACSGGILKVYELQLEGHKRMDADAFQNGNGREMIGKVFA